MRKFLKLIIMVVLLGLFSFKVQADQTYVTSMETTIETWNEVVDLTVWQTTFGGPLRGDISGEVNGSETTYVIEDGIFSGYQFTFGHWEITTDNNTYSGIYSSFEAPTDEEGIASNGDIAAVSYNSDVFSIARIGSEQTSGTFYGDGVESDEENAKVYHFENITLHIERNLYLGQGEGYYNGSIAAHILSIDPELPANISFPSADFSLITYLCDLGDGKAFDVYWDEGGNEYELGASTSPLYGVFIPGEEPNDIIIEHAAPIPSTMFLLGSLLLGILGIKRKIGS